MNALVETGNALLTVLPDMTLDQWAAEGRRLFGHSNELQWRVAVWLTDGEDRWEEALQIAEDLGISEHRRRQSKYIVKAARSLPLTVNLLALPFWHWDTIAAVKPEDREAFALRMIELQPTQKEIRTHYAEYKQMKAIAPPEQPQFSNGLADGAEDDGLALPPHGVTRNRVEEIDTPQPEDDQTDVFAQPDPADPIDALTEIGFSVHGATKVVDFMRYWEMDDPIAALEKIVDQLFTIKRARLAKDEDTEGE